MWWWGAPRKTLSHNDLTLFRVGIFTTLKSVKHLSISHLQVAPNTSSRKKFTTKRHQRRFQHHATSRWSRRACYIRWILPRVSCSPDGYCRADCRGELHGYPEDSDRGHTCGLSVEWTEDGSGNESSEQGWKRRCRTVPATRMEDGNVYMVLGGAPRKILYHNDLTLFRVGNFITLKTA